MIKHLSLLGFIILFALSTKAQKVYSVNYESQADVKIFVVKYESQCDLKVYKVDYESQAGWRDKSKMHLLY